LVDSLYWERDKGMDNLQAVAWDMRGAADSDAAIALLSTRLREFGFERFAYARMPVGRSGQPDSYVSVSTLPDDWVRDYTEGAFYRHDVMAQHCLRSTDPYPWSRYHAGVESGEINGPWAELGWLARDWGVANGVTVPLRSAGSFRAGISLVADPEADPRDRERAFERHRDEILALVESFHATVELGAVAAAEYRVTARELEVLRWVADGFRTGQIADRLGTSAHTVEKQLRAARDRLGAATVPQAVARAIALGILT